MFRPNTLGHIIAGCRASIPKHVPDAGLNPSVVRPNYLHGILVITAPLVG
ncbi:MAG: hypothetical protein M3R02_18540 [Chloroflexota bacterium]|nr:hypothetical protein [Chloroflexota bacterium]